MDIDIQSILNPGFTTNYPFLNFWWSVLLFGGHVFIITPVLCVRHISGKKSTDSPLPHSSVALLPGDSILPLLPPSTVLCGHISLYPVPPRMVFKNISSWEGR